MSFGAIFAVKQRKVRRRRLRMDPRSSSCVWLSRSFSSSATFAFAELQRREQVLHPPLMLQPLQHPQRILLVEDLFRLIAALERPHRRDVLLFLARLIPSRGLLFHLPAQPRHEPRRPDHPHRVFDEPIVAHQPQLAVLDIRHAVQRIHQQPIRPIVQRQRHRVRRKVPPPQVVQNAGRLGHHGFPGFGKSTAACCQPPSEHRPETAQTAPVTPHFRPRSHRRLSPDLSSA